MFQNSCHIMIFQACVFFCKPGRSLNRSFVFDNWWFRTMLTSFCLFVRWSVKRNINWAFSSILRRCVQFKPKDGVFFKHFSTKDVVIFLLKKLSDWNSQHPKKFSNRAAKFRQLVTDYECTLICCLRIAKLPILIIREHCTQFIFQAL